MKTYLETHFEQCRADFLGQVAYMDTKNREQAERHGGIEYLKQHPESDAAKRYFGLESRFIKFAAYDDAVLAYIAELSRVIESQAQTIVTANQQLREYRAAQHRPLEPPPRMSHAEFLGLTILASRIPKRVGALLDHREALREASKINAATLQPHLYR